MFIDVETGLIRGDEPGRVWLAGQWRSGEIWQFTIPDEAVALAGYLRDNGIGRLTSWTRYDHKALKPLVPDSSSKLNSAMRANAHRIALYGGRIR